MPPIADAPGALGQEVRPGLGNDWRDNMQQIAAALGVYSLRIRRKGTRRLRIPSGLTEPLAPLAPRVGLMRGSVSNAQLFGGSNSVGTSVEDEVADALL